MGPWQTLNQHESTCPPKVHNFVGGSAMSIDRIQKYPLGDTASVPQAFKEMRRIRESAIRRSGVALGDQWTPAISGLCRLAPVDSRLSKTWKKTRWARCESFTLLSPCRSSPESRRPCELTSTRSQATAKTSSANSRRTSDGGSPASGGDALKSGAIRSDPCGSGAADL